MTRMNIVPQLADEDSKDVSVKLRAENELVDEIVQQTVRELNMRNDAKSKNVTRWRAHMTLGVLLLANLLNYIDRYTLAGVLSDVKLYYSINNADTGLLQTSFIVSYMLLSPIFGYLGDRYNRKIIMAVGIFFWSGVTLAGSFVPRENFYTFLFLRAMVGIGEASYSTIAPTIIADLFVKDMRSKALTIFYIAIPLGSGLGYIVGSNVAHAMGGWQWALRVTPGFGILCVLLILLVLREPPRGAAEGATHLANTSWSTDVMSLMKNKSFLLSTGGFTCVAFVAGALALWAPLFMEYSIVYQDHTKHIKDLESSVPWKFGVITCVAGLLGVMIGAEAGRRLRKTYGYADPLVCAFGLIGSAPMFCLAIYLSDKNTIATWVLVFLAETLLCLNWSLVTDMLLYIVVPTRRSTAEAIQILISHTFGDAGSPYLIGAVSDAIARRLGYVDSVATKFTSLQMALYIACFICVIGGGFFLATALFIRHDRGKVDKYVQGILALTDSETGSSSCSTSSMIHPAQGAVCINGGRDPQSLQPLVSNTEVA